MYRLRYLIYPTLVIASIYTAHFTVDLFIPVKTTEADILRAHTYLESESLPTPDYEFTRDGCTLWPDRLPYHDFTEACLTHDIAYWAGGSLERQAKANLDFKEAVTQTGPAGKTLGFIMYVGVEYLGDNGVSRAVGSHWGYGWK